MGNNKKKQTSHKTIITMVTSMERSDAPHNWVTKDSNYLALPRSAKHEIIWQQITANEQSGNWHTGKHFEVEPRAAFDEQGDEFDCRQKNLPLRRKCGQGHLGQPGRPSLHRYVPRRRQWLHSSQLDSSSRQRAATLVPRHRHQVPPRRNRFGQYCRLVRTGWLKQS